MSKRVKYPLFELVGPPCDIDNCDGKKIQTINWRTDMALMRCSSCGNETNQMTCKELFDYSVRTIMRVYNSEDEN